MGAETLGAAPDERDERGGRDERVTVVVPTRDRPALLPQSVACALGQVDVDVRVLVVDDGSATPAERVLPADPRLRVLRHDRSRGVSAARNAALAAVETPWTAFLDDDDLWGPRKLRRQLDAVADGSCAWACSATVSFLGGAVLDVLGVPADGDLSQAIRSGNVVPGSASGVLARTGLVRAVGGFDESLPSMEDWDLWIRLAQESPIALVPAVDVACRQHPTSRGHDLTDQPRALALMQAKYADRQPPIAVAPDRWFYEYWARMEYDSGRWSRGLRRTADLLVRHRHLAALRTPVGAVLPPGVQRRLRARRLAGRVRRQPDLDWSWLAPSLRP